MTDVRLKLAADRGYDKRAFVGNLRTLQVTPHVARNEADRRSAIDVRTTRHEGYAISQRKRKLVEKVFGWMKTVALQRKTRFCEPDGQLSFNQTARDEALAIIINKHCRLLESYPAGYSNLLSEHAIRKL